LISQRSYLQRYSIPRTAFLSAIYRV